MSSSPRGSAAPAQRPSPDSTSPAHAAATGVHRAPPPPAGDQTGTFTRNVTGTVGSVTGTHTQASAGVQGEGTRTIFSPLNAGELPDVAAIRGLRLEQVLLISVAGMVVAVVGLLAVLAALSTRGQFQETSERFHERLRLHAQELGTTVTHTLSLTSATSLRDNNFAFLTEVARSIVQDNQNILRVQMVDADGAVVADTDPATQLGTHSGRRVERGMSTAAYKNQPVLEFQEPIDYGSQSGKGVVVISYSLSPLQAQLAELETTRSEAVRQTAIRMGLLGGGFVLVAALLAALLSRRITRPLGALTGKVMQLATGDLSARAEERAGVGREVHTLAVVFNHMAERIKVLLEDVRAKAQLERDVSLARTVQETFLPSREPQQVGSVRVAGLVTTADACGGDWWLRATLADGRVVVGLGDVTGHGLSTALVATSATSGFAATLTTREPHQVDACSLITALNQTLANVARGEYQMSSALAVIDPRTGHIDYAAGGHPSALVYNRYSGKASSLLARGALLGASINSQYAARQGQLTAGDIIVWYTDGLTECRDPAGKQYGMQRLAQVVQANAQQPAEVLRDIILADARAFTVGRPQEDDTTVLVVEYSPVA